MAGLAGEAEEKTPYLSLMEFEFENFMRLLDYGEADAHFFFKSFDPFARGEIPFSIFSEVMLGAVNPSIVLEEFVRNREFITWIERF